MAMVGFQKPMATAALRSLCEWLSGAHGHSASKPHGCSGERSLLLQQLPGACCYSSSISSWLWRGSRSQWLQRPSGAFASGIQEPMAIALPKLMAVAVTGVCSYSSFQEPAATAAPETHGYGGIPGAHGYSIPQELVPTVRLAGASSSSPF
jgi:hypothetical protein